MKLLANRKMQSLSNRPRSRLFALMFSATMVLTACTPATVLVTSTPIVVTREVTREVTLVPTEAPKPTEAPQEPVPTEQPAPTPEPRPTETQLPVQVVVAVPTSTPEPALPAATAVPPPTPEPTESRIVSASLEVTECSSGTDIRHGLGDVKNATVVFQNKGNVALTQVKLVLAAEDQDRGVHQNQQIVIQRVMPTERLIYKMTVDTKTKKPTLLTITAVSNEKLDVSVSYECNK